MSFKSNYLTSRFSCRFSCRFLYVFCLHVFCLLALVTASLVHAETPRSPQVERYMREANYAGAFLDSGDVARMEQTLEPGYNEISLMIEAYRPSAETNNYLRRRGWGHLVWTQLMYRLLAIQNGVYDRELEFAERVAMEAAARGSLRVVETSLGRIATLLKAKEEFGLSEDIDQFAQSLLGDAATSYQEVFESYQMRFADRKKTVLARLALGRHPGIIDPADIPAGTVYAERCAAHRDRLQGENRVDEILNRLAEYDAGRVGELVDTVAAAKTATEKDAAVNELRVQLLFLEDSLAASESDPHIRELLATYEDLGYVAFSPLEGCSEEFRDVMLLVRSARHILHEQSDPVALRGLYALSETVR